MFESRAEALKREVCNDLTLLQVDAKENTQEVLGALNELVQNWVVQVHIEKGFDEERARQQRGQIFTFGSYRLGTRNLLCYAAQF